MEAFMKEDESQLSQSALGDSATGLSHGDDSSATSGDHSSKFVQKETRHVFYLRVFVLLVLFSASAAISLVVYFVTDNGDEDSFESSYHAAADKVTETFLSIASVKLQAAGGLAVAMIAHGVDSETGSWPFITLSSFQQRATTAKDLSNFLYVGFNPVVTHANRMAWENYTQNHPDAQWYQEGREYQKTIGIDDLDNRPQVKTDDPELDLSTGVANYIYDFDRETTGKGVISPEAAWYLPIWQTSPVTQRSMVNQNRASNSEGALNCIKYQEVVFEGMQYSNPGFGSDDNPLTAEIAWLLRLANKERTKYEGDIFSTVYFPIYDTFDVSTRQSVAIMRGVIHWVRMFQEILLNTITGLVFVLENNGCDEPYTYRIDGEHAYPIGHGDLHDRAYDKFEKTASFASIDRIADGTREGMKLQFNQCPYQIRVYPSSDMEAAMTSGTPVVVTVSVAIVFLFVIFMFFGYDRLVEVRQRVLLNKAKRTHRIVASLFPKNIRDQILNDEGELRTGGLLGAKNNLKSFVKGGVNDNQFYGQMPIADMYPECTVMFADIGGFTDWASSREPGQVFVLLQHVYSTFDEIARKKKIFKVETVGDSYVACAGVPEAEPAHAIKMARFSTECLVGMREVVRELETELGPDTGDLSVRIGLNSGPVTAGLLRGAQSRFQVFGDTVNGAARMESTGRVGKIQCSQSTADKLTQSGKEHWLQIREDAVASIGKGGHINTYWIVLQNNDQVTDTNVGEDEDVLAVDFSGKLADELLKHERQVEWAAELLRDSIREIVAAHATKKGKVSRPSKETNSRSTNRIPLDEVVDVIEMPRFESKSADSELFAVKIPEKVNSLVREYVSIISGAYLKNPFHNFEHACHVSLCSSKFLKRIVTPDLSDDELAKIKDTKKRELYLHEYTHGINSDPITLFTILFAALIHDVDHPGVSNKQFGVERPFLADRYRHKSIAEQNSVAVAWEVLMDSHFRDMREYIFETNEELSRFRQVVVNVVLATDIFDPELTELRKKRWSQAFSESATSDGSIIINDARATVVLEHIMQASDVAHTMQHWHTYRRFNANLFRETAAAYRQGRCAVDPATFWYEGELKFFDSYIIPLAKKLRDCNIFGVSSDECLNFATRNRAEWEACGKGIVAENVQALAEEERKYSRQGGHRMLSLGQSNISSSSHQQQEEKEEETE